MKSIVTYVRNLLGWCDEDDPAIKASFKRDRYDTCLQRFGYGGKDHSYQTSRFLPTGCNTKENMYRIPLKEALSFWKTDDDFFSDEAPALKRLKQLKRSSFPNTLSSNDIWAREESKNVRYVPIQVEKGHPSTSTPIEMSHSGNRVRTRPVKLVDVSENGTMTPSRISRPRMHTPKRPVLHEVEDDDDEEITWVESKPGKSSKPELYIDLNDDDPDQEEQENDVIYVKKVTPSSKPTGYKCYAAKVDRRDSTEDDGPYYRIKKINERNSSLSPRSYTRFKAPSGIKKTYKKPGIPQWLQPQKPSTSSARSRLLNVNGSNIRSTLSEVFNLDEKRNYQELIRRVAGTTKPVSFGRPIDIINLADDSASFRNTQRAQKKSLNEIRLVEKGLLAEREGEETKEYDPITVASINSSDSEIEVVPSESSTTSSVKIDPINTLKDSYRDKAITSTDWLSKIETKYRKKRQDTQEKLKDARRESDIISKVNYEQKLAHLEHKLKYELSIPESLIEEVPPTVELPELTPEQEKLIKRALGPGPPGQLIVEKFNLRIHRRDLQTLAGLNWLNDEVINFYMNLLMQRSEERKDLPKVYATNTFFYPKLMQSGQAGLRRWTRKVDVFAHDLMVVPVHLGVHWCLALVDFRNKKVQYLDSMGGRNQQCLDALLQYLRDEHQDKKGQPFDDSGWRMECLSKDIPQQMNGSDCGMFSCTFAEFSARDAPYTFTQSHMPYLRRKAALEIITGKLLL